MHGDHGRWARLATNGLAAALAAAGIAITLNTDRGRILAMPPMVPPIALFLLLVAGFAVAELALLHVELRRQAYSFSLSGIALLLGIEFSDTRILVTARVTGAVLVFAWQRLPLLKVTYNLGAYTLEAGLVGFSLHRILGSGAELTLPVAVTCYLVVGLVDVLMSALVLLVISWHQGRVTAGEAIEVFLPASVLGLFCTLSALAITVLLEAGALGGVLIVGFAILAALLYRGYLGLRRRHQSLALMHEFVEQSVGAGTVEELAEVLLTRARRLLNASEVELAVYRADSDLLLRVAEDDAVSVSRSDPSGPEDWLLSRVCKNADAIVLPRTTRERELRQWLVAHQARDAMIVPLLSVGIEGVLVVKDRMGETSTFTPDDLTLLQTLAGHLAVALRGTQLVQQLRHGAHHDGLTGLANRVLLTERIEQALNSATLNSATLNSATLNSATLNSATLNSTTLNSTTLNSATLNSATLNSATLNSATLNSTTLNSTTLNSTTRATRQFAVLLLDLDKFKEVNDALGHHVGDALLRVVGSRIQDCVPADGTVARLGGDEFAVLLPILSTETDAQGEAERVADAVLAALISPIVLPEAVVSTRASIGIAIAKTGFNGADLLRHADTAMYAAKAGERAVVFYTEDLDHGRAERLTLLADLAVALQHDELELRYQPQLDLRTDKVVSVEALVRWRHPVRGLLGPDEFIPLAESSGLIEELTRQVLSQALRQCRRWRDSGLDLVVAVNLSAYNVNNADLADNVATALAEAGLPADRLVMEITESSVMGDPHRTVPILQRLADIGVTLSLDDFGTGYSSLAYLQKLPVREVKIDKSFVMGMTEGCEAHASSVLVRSILTLCSNLGLRVVAEGVENLEVLELLHGLGCDAAQGYFIARPLSAEELGRCIAVPNSIVIKQLSAARG